MEIETQLDSITHLLSMPSCLYKYTQCCEEQDDSLFYTVATTTQSISLNIG
jgi:hypothetical protein